MIKIINKSKIDEIIAKIKLKKNKSKIKPKKNKSKIKIKPKKNKSKTKIIQKKMINIKDIIISDLTKINLFDFKSDYIYFFISILHNKNLIVKCLESNKYTKCTHYYIYDDSIYIYYFDNINNPFIIIIMANNYDIKIQSIYYIKSKILYNNDNKIESIYYLKSNLIFNNSNKIVTNIIKKIDKIINNKIKILENKICANLLFSNMRGITNPDHYILYTIFLIKLIELNLIENINTLCINDKYDILHIGRYISKHYNIKIKNKLIYTNKFPLLIPTYYNKDHKLHNIKFSNIIYQNIITYNNSLINIDLKYDKQKLYIYIQLKDNRRRITNFNDFVADFICRCFDVYNENIIFFIGGVFYNYKLNNKKLLNNKYDFTKNDEAYLNNIKFNDILNKIINRNIEYKKFFKNIFNLINYPIDIILKYISITDFNIGQQTSGPFNYISYFYKDKYIFILGSLLDIFKYTDDDTIIENTGKKNIFLYNTNTYIIKNIIINNKIKMTKNNFKIPSVKNLIYKLLLILNEIKLKK